MNLRRKSHSYDGRKAKIEAMSERGPRRPRMNEPGGNPIGIPGLYDLQDLNRGKEKTNHLSGAKAKIKVMNGEKHRKNMVKEARDPTNAKPGLTVLQDRNPGLIKKKMKSFHHQDRSG